MSKRIIAAILAVMLLTLCTACGTSEDGGAGPDSTDVSSPVSADVDLAAFYEDIAARFQEQEFNASIEMYGDFLDAAYPGLSEIDTKQLTVHEPMMSSVVCEIALAEAADAAVLEEIRTVFQARIDTQVGTDDNPGTAWYPESIEGWKNDSRIVTHGNYIMMIAWEHCDDVVAEFDKLFV